MRLTIQYTCAVLLIVSSIALAFYQVIDIKDIASGVILYIAQAFLLAGSIFGLSYYVRLIKNYIDENKTSSPRNPEQ